MIISENGISVGKLDEETLALTDVRSAKLQQLVDGWRKNGFEVAAAADIPDDFPEPKPDCAMTFVHVPFDKECLGFIALQLSIAGYDVQRRA